MAHMDQKTSPENVVTQEEKKIGLVLQGGAALGAYEVGAIEYLYESGMECAIAAGASSGAMNAVTLAGAKEYPPKVLQSLWEELMVDPPIPFVPPLVRQSWSMFGVPHMYSPRWDYWNLPSWTYFCNTTLLKKTLEDLLDWEQVRDPKHMRVFVSASGVETGETAYFSNKDPNHPLGIEHVLASGSFPPGFPWTMVDHRAYWDGGLTDNTPLKPVIDHLEGDEPESMPIFMIDVFSSSAPLPTNMQQVFLRMFELLLQNKLKADSGTAQSYTRFIRVVRAMAGELPADARVRTEYKDDFEAVMKYVLVNEMRMIDVMKPAEESAADFSRETILRRISAGYDAARRELEAKPLKGVQKAGAPLTSVP